MKKITLLIVFATFFLPILSQGGWSWEQEDPYFITTTTTIKSPKPISPTTPFSITTTPAGSSSRCLKRCPSTSEYNPVCGTDSMTYNNHGKLLCAKKCGTNVEKSRDGVCGNQPVTSTTASPSTTPDPVCFKRCPKTREYNPICGSDGITYLNENHLKCVQQCGARVKKVLVGPCGSPTSSTSVTPSTKTTTLPPNFRACIRQCVVSSQYQPVCASNGNTYDNESELQCDITCGRNVRKIRNGTC